MVQAALGALVGGGIGAGTAALTGGDIGKGALIGAGTGAVGGPIIGRLAPSTPFIGAGTPSAATAATGTVTSFPGSMGPSLGLMPPSPAALAGASPLGTPLAARRAARLAAIGKAAGGATAAIAALNQAFGEKERQPPIQVSAPEPLRLEQPAPVQIGGLTPRFPPFDTSSFELQRQRQIEMLLNALARNRRFG